MENLFRYLDDDRPASPVVPKRVAALRAEVKQTRKPKTTKRRRLTDIQPSPLALPPIIRKSSKMTANSGLDSGIRGPDRMSTYRVLPPIGRRNTVADCVTNMRSISPTQSQTDTMTDRQTESDSAGQSTPDFRRQPFTLPFDPRYRRRDGI